MMPLHRIRTTSNGSEEWELLQLGEGLEEYPNAIIVVEANTLIQLNIRRRICAGA
jgi:hypothetical protein